MHVGLIVDGARRWAKQNDVPLRDTYERAFDAMTDLIVNLVATGVSDVSAYLLSRDNLQRSPSDLEAVFAASANFLRSVLPDLARRLDLKVQVAGDPLAVSAPYRDALNAVVTATSGAQYGNLYLLVAYSPAEELANCWRPGTTTMDSLIPQLWVPKRVDLVIRTGGAPLLSDFLPLQCGYARIWWTPRSFSELEWSDVADVVRETQAANQLKGR